MLGYSFLKAVQCSYVNRDAHGPFNDPPEFIVSTVHLYCCTSVGL